MSDHSVLKFNRFVPAFCLLVLPRSPTAAPADGDLQAARDRLLANARALATTTIPMATEPAFQFKA